MVGTTFLVTGGLGYIGSHTVVALVEFLVETKVQDPRVLVIDNLSNCESKAEKNIIEIVKSQNNGKLPFPIEFSQLDLLDLKSLEVAFQEAIDFQTPIKYILHFAGKKAVGESMSMPLNYFEVNVVGAVNLLKCMEKFKCYGLQFSSSASVYGNNPYSSEDDEKKPQSVYAQTKHMVEEMMIAICRQNPEYSMAILRYFNVVGAHPSGLIGDSPKGIPNNLFPYIQDVIVKKRPHLNIFGQDWSTEDGTAVRDYIHVLDIAGGHIAALKKMMVEKGLLIFNLGSGVGQSVLQIHAAFSKVNISQIKVVGEDIPMKFAERREGDVAVIVANVDKAKRELNWSVKYTIDDMCKTSYDFCKKQVE